MRIPERRHRYRALSIALAVSIGVLSLVQPTHAVPALATSGNWTGGENNNAGTPGWQEFVGITLMSTLDVSVNAVNGNLFASYALPALPGVNGLNQNLGLRYNSFNRSSLGSVGYGWGLNMSRDVGLDVSNVNAPVFVDASGHPWTFTKSGSAYTSPPGIDADLVQNGNGTYTLTDHDSQSKYQLSSTGFLTAIQNRSANQIAFNYGANNLPTSIVNTEGQTTSFTASSTGSAVGTVTTPDAQSVVSLTYSAGNDLTGISYNDGTGFSTSLGYDNNNDLTSITDRNHAVVQIHYTNNGAGPSVSSITQVTNSQTGTGPTWTFTYGSGSTAVTDPNNHTTTYTYDGSGRVTGITHPDGKTLSRSWTADNQLSQEVRPSGATTTWTYDGLNRLMQTTLGNGATESWAYNNTTFPYNPSSYTDTQGNTTSFGYNSQGLLNSTTDASGHTWSAVYNANGTMASETDRNNHSTTFSYDSLARLQVVTPPSPVGPTTLSYTGNDWVASAIDGKNQTTTYSYNKLGQLLGDSYADSSSVGYAYDGDGNALSMADTSGTTNDTYNTLGQLTQETLPGGQTISYTWDAVDNLLTKSDSAGTVTYGYTVNDELHSVTDPQGKQTVFQYDQDGNQTQIAYPNGISENMTYDGAAQLTSIAATGCLTGTCPSFSYSYTNPANGRPTTQRYSVTDATGNTTSYGYDVLNRLTSAVQKNSAGTQIASYTYGYDPAGNMTSENRNGTTTTLSYNSADELTQATGGINKSYTYDANGNLTGETNTGCQLGNCSALGATYNAQDQATSMTVGSNSISMTYSGMGQGSRLTNGTNSYQYDETGVSIFNGGTTTVVNTPDGQPVSERVETVLLGGGGGTSYATYYYLYDGLGSVAAVADSSGNIRDSYSYDPYGNTTSVSEPVSNPFRFTGAIWDSSTGLYKMGERFYDPAIGRFTQPDPYAGEGYVYAGDNPTNFVDPEGLKHHKKKHKKNHRHHHHHKWNYSNTAMELSQASKGDSGLPPTWSFLHQVPEDPAPSHPTMGPAPPGTPRTGDNLSMSCQQTVDSSIFVASTYGGALALLAGSDLLAAGLLMLTIGSPMMKCPS